MRLIIGNKNYSSWSLRPWLLLSTYGIAFEEVRIPLYTEETAATIARYSAAGKVPVLQDDDLVVWDSLAICEYVNERYLHGRGWPDEARARAEARSCSAEMHSGFSELRSRMPMNCRAVGRSVPIPPVLAKEIARIEQIWSSCRERYGPNGPWLFGSFSIADCMFAPVAVRFRTYGISLSKTAADYRDLVLRMDSLRDWIGQAEAETETIEVAEIGSSDLGNQLPGESRSSGAI